MIYQPLERAGLIEPFHLPLSIFPPPPSIFRPKLTRLDRIRKKRHRAVYRMAGAISEREAKGTIEFAEKFVTQLANLI